MAEHHTPPPDIPYVPFLDMIFPNDSFLHEANGSHHHGITMALWNFDYVHEPYVITFFLLVLIVFKVLYEHVHIVAHHLPESCALILLGLLIGGIMKASDIPDEMAHLFLYNQKGFFLYLLPPIILESAYSLRDKVFVKLLGPVLLFAVVGTVLNVFIFGPVLFGLYKVGALGTGLDANFMDFIIFSAIIAAVDPVAVLAIFQQLGVNKTLYFLVFGEALLNDAVTIVIYRVVLAFKYLPEITGNDVGLGIASFFCVALGAIAIGLCFGVLTAFITKFTDKLRILEPPLLCVMGYLAYLTAEMVEFSGIFAMVICVFHQCQYACENISSKSFLTVTYLAKAASNMTESIIFLIIGVMIIQAKSWDGWHTGFVLWSCVIMILTRFIVVYALTTIVDLFREKRHRIKWQEQFLIAYGGLRGAISFSLAIILSDDWTNRNTILSATFIIVLLTVFVQGTSIKPLVKLLKIEAANNDVNLFVESAKWSIKKTTIGIEAITGHLGLSVLKDIWHQVNRIFVRKVLQKKEHVVGTRFLMNYQEKALRSKMSQPTMRDGVLVNGSTANLNKTYSNQDLKLLDPSLLPSTFADAYMDASTQQSNKYLIISKELRQLQQRDEQKKVIEAMRHAMLPAAIATYRRNDASCNDIIRSDSSESMQRVWNEIANKRRRKRSLLRKDSDLSTQGISFDANAPRRKEGDSSHATRLEELKKYRNGGPLDLSHIPNMKSRPPMPKSASVMWNAKIADYGHDNHSLDHSDIEMNGITIEARSSAETDQVRKNGNGVLPSNENYDNPTFTIENEENKTFSLHRHSLSSIESDSDENQAE